MNVTMAPLPGRTFDRPIYPAELLVYDILSDEIAFKTNIHFIKLHMAAAKVLTMFMHLERLNLISSLNWKKNSNPKKSDVEKIFLPQNLIH